MESEGQASGDGDRGVILSFPAWSQEEHSWPPAELGPVHFPFPVGLSRGNFCCFFPLPGVAVGVTVLCVSKGRTRTGVEIASETPLRSFRWVPEAPSPHRLLL